MQQSQPNELLGNYQLLDHTFDEMFSSSDRPHAEFATVVEQINNLGTTELLTRQHLASHAFLTGGITFSVYSNHQGTEKIFPFDVIPRMISAKDWELVERGVVQRMQALNLFLADIYGEKRIFREGKVPQDIVESSEAYLPKMCGIRPPGGIHVQIGGIDLIRDSDGNFLALEDNLRTPSGVSYVLENRAVMKRALAPVLSKTKIRPVDEYPTRLRDALASLAPHQCEEPRTVVLTPGSFNSAYFEHTFLARRMGCDLVCPSDLFVHQDHVFVKTTAGPQQVDVIYRRIDDDFLDPKFFRPDSLLGVPGIVDVYAKGNLTLANAIGNGVADDKAIYPYVPDIIRFYLSEEPILGQIETFHCENTKERDHVLNNLQRMVVKEVNGSGGYGMLMGHKASKNEIDEFAEKIRANPRNYIAQPLVQLSSCPTMIDDNVGARRVDLRPFVITGRSTWVLPGGLTRVALEAGSYIVNSSQGGGSKDTWVLESQSHDLSSC